MQPAWARKGGVVLAYGALCRGLLTGKITAKTEFKGDDLRKTDPKFRQPRLRQYLAAVERLDRILAETITDDVGPEFMAPQPSRPAEPSRQKRAS